MSLWGRVTSRDYWSDVGHDLSAMGSSVANAPTYAVRNLLTEPTAELRSAAQNVGGLPADLTSGLPQTGTNVGQGVGNLGYFSLSGIGGGLGAGLGSVGSGVGSGVGDLGLGLGKGLLPIALIGAGLVLVLVLSTKGRTIQARGVSVA